MPTITITRACEILEEAWGIRVTWRQIDYWINAGYISAESHGGKRHLNWDALLRAQALAVASIWTKSLAPVADWMNDNGARGGIDRCMVIELDGRVKLTLDLLDDEGEADALDMFTRNS